MNEVESSESSESGLHRSVGPGDSGDASDLDLLDAAPPPTQWPKVIGIISLIYAIGGLLCQIVIGIWTVVLAEVFMGMGGIDAPMPMSFKLVTGGSAVVLLVLGVVLLLGAIHLLQRKRAGVSMHKFWAITRLLWLVIAVVIGVFMIPTNIAYQREISDPTNRILIERGQTQGLREFDEDSAWRGSVIMTAVMGGVLAVYPLFIGFYLSRRTIADEVSQWE
jgi:hypothetical protein